MSLYRDNGVVLRTYKMGEADRIVVLLTEHHGKVRAVAKGVRRTNSKFGGRLEPLSHVALLMWRGRGELDLVNQAEVIDHFRGARGAGPGDPGSVDARVRRPAGPGGPGRPPPLRDADRRAAGAGRPGARAALVPAAFFLKALALEGASPVLEGCASCGAADTGSSWSPSTLWRAGRSVRAAGGADR